MRAYRYDHLASQLRSEAGGVENSESAGATLVSLARARERSVGYVVLEGAAGRARIRTHHADDVLHVSDQRIVGSDAYIHEAAGGGLSHAHHAHRTEETWTRNAALYASAVDAIVLAEPIDFVIVTGDAHVVELIHGALSKSSQQLVVLVGIDTLAEGSSQAVLGSCIVHEKSRILEGRHKVALNELLMEIGLSERTGIHAVVAELQESAVATLLINEDALAGLTLVALPDRPWISEVPEAPDPSLQVVPAVQALVRAAILTGSDIVFATAGALPDGAAVAATTRWAPDGQKSMVVESIDTSRDDVVTSDAAAAPHLTSHHRKTLDHIMQQPSSNNVTWRDTMSLLEQAGVVEIGANGRVTFTVGDETESFESARTKDLDVQTMVDLRRMLVGAGFSSR